uniref:Olfactomedin-like domain-containing protein n=1 Tax=Arion vulgaris TaxID=1028688 RepID=A0A0B6ZQJ0_9EUPU
MAGKVLFEREQEKRPHQILQPSLQDKHNNDIDDIPAIACVSGQNGTDDLPTKENFKESVLYSHNLTAVNNYSLHFHIRVLYAIVVILSVVLMSSIIICYLEISSLKQVMTRQLTVGGLVDFEFPVRKLQNLDLQMPYISPEDELSLGGFWEGEEFTEDLESKSRSKRHAGFHEGSGTADDWLWMSSFARVPIVALQSYCREAQLYCAATGKPGTPGSAGPKGEVGEKGEKGDFADESAIAGSLANIEAVRGPPGHKGEPGTDGLPGPVGPQGATGSSGIPGEKGNNGYPGLVGPLGPKGDFGPPGRDGNSGMNGAKGDRGPMGPQGERGISGLPGVPGLKGLHGDPGHPGIDGLPGVDGPKGERGYCQVGCGETERARTYTVATTPKPTFPPRTKECSIEVFGVPVYMRDSSDKYGSWMKESKPFRLSKIWVTYGKEGNSLFEYSSFDNFKKDLDRKEISLSGSPYFGTGHVVHEGYFYYHWSGTAKIVRFDLANGQATTVRTIPDMVYESSTTLNGQGFLYQSQAMFVHFNVDQNGLWIIYGNDKSEKMSVALLNPETLDVINSVSIDLKLGSKGGAFIVCGKLYTLKHHNRQRSYLDEEYDLWHGHLKPLRIHFNNPYMETYMIAFDANINQMLAWDGGRLLATPLLLKSD